MRDKKKEINKNEKRYKWRQKLRKGFFSSHFFNVGVWCVCEEKDVKKVMTS